jgi:hypothetical protein
MVELGTLEALMSSETTLLHALIAERQGIRV